MARVLNTTITVPVVHGNVAHYMGDCSQEHRTHHWAVYLRPTDNAILSTFIKNVDFILHPSIIKPIRQVTEMPYEIQEYGYGEFHITIKISFHDSMEKPVEIIHPLSLFKSDGTVSKGDPIVAEYYDELVFPNPTEKMFSLLRSTKHGPHVKLPQSLYRKYYTSFSDTEKCTLYSVEEAREKIREKKLSILASFEKLEEERAALLKELEDMENDTEDQIKTTWTKVDATSRKDSAHTVEL